MYICIDFDGTIVDHRFPEIGPAVPEAIETMQILQALGHNLILFTMRSDKQESGNVLTDAVKYIEDRGISLFGVNTNPTQNKWTKSPKAYGEIYIDDAAIGCPLIQPEGFLRPCVDWRVVRTLLRI